MSKWWHDWVYFRRSERWGLVVVAIGACVLLAVMWIKEGQVMTVEEAASAATDTLVEAAPDEASPAEFRLRCFDPNTVTFSELSDMGFAPTLAVNLIKWRTAGKVFRIPEEVMEIYGWDALSWDTLEPFVSIGEAYAIVRHEPRYEPYGAPNERQQWAEERQRRTDSLLAVHPYLKNKYTEFTQVDINSADTTELMRVPGIGPYFAKNIVTQRERLGGFVSTEQLFDLDQFPEEAVAWFVADSLELRRIKLGAASVSEMAKHPYIGYDRARAIANYRRLYGPINSLERLRQTRFFTDEELERLAPYLDFSAD